jgi:hypothetical protein
MKRYILSVVFLCVLAGIVSAGMDVQLYKGNENPVGYKVIVSSWMCRMPWGLRTTTSPVISDEVLSMAGYPVWNNDWLIDNQGDGTTSFDVWNGTSSFNCVTTGNRETFCLRKGKAISIDGRSTGQIWFRTLQATTNETTLYMFLSGENPVGSR